MLQVMKNIDVYLFYERTVRENRFRLRRKGFFRFARMETGTSNDSPFLLRGRLNQGRPVVVKFIPGGMIRKTNFLVQRTTKGVLQRRQTLMPTGRFGSFFSNGLEVAPPYWLMPQGNAAGVHDFRENGFDSQESRTVPYLHVVVFWNHISCGFKSALSLSIFGQAFLNWVFSSWGR